MLKGFNYLVMGFFIISVIFSVTSMAWAVSADNSKIENMRSLSAYNFKSIFVSEPFIPDETGYSVQNSHNLSIVPFDMIDEDKLVKCNDRPRDVMPRNLDNVRHVETCWSTAVETNNIFYSQN